MSSQKLEGFSLIQKPAGVFFLAETRFQKRFKLPIHSHRFHSISIVLEGSFIERKGVNSRKRECFDVDVITVDEPHAANFPDCGAHGFNLEVPMNWVESILLEITAWSARNAVQHKHHTGFTPSEYRGLTYKS